MAHRVQQLGLERDRAQERLRRAAILFVDGEIDRAGYDLARDKAQADFEAAQAELGRIQGTTLTVSLPPLDDVLRDLGGWSTVLHGGDVTAKRDLLGLLIDKVTPFRVSYGKYDAQITWTALGASLLHLVSTLG
jgi:hypothetical protein